MELNLAKKVFETEGMDEDHFWKLVAIADWPKRKTDDVKIEYMKMLNAKEADQFHNVADRLSSLIDQLVGDRNPAGGGDDSHWDMCRHIVGMGREEYYRHLGDYSAIKHLGETDGYTECFTYCIPYEDDYKHLTPKEMREWSGRNAKEIRDFLKIDTRAVLAPSVTKKLKELADIFKDGKKDISLITANKEKIVTDLEVLADYFEKERDELPRKFPNFNHWQFTNLISDLEIMKKLEEK